MKYVACRLPVNWRRGVSINRIENGKFKRTGRIFSLSFCQLFMIFNCNPNGLYTVRIVKLNRMCTCVLPLFQYRHSTITCWHMFFFIFAQKIKGSITKNLTPEIYPKHLIRITAHFWEILIGGQLNPLISSLHLFLLFAVWVMPSLTPYHPDPQVPKQFRLQRRLTLTLSRPDLQAPKPFRWEFLPVRPDLKPSRCSSSQRRPRLWLTQLLPPLRPLPHQYHNTPNRSWGLDIRYDSQIQFENSVHQISGPWSNPSTFKAYAHRLFYGNTSHGFNRVHVNHRFSWWTCLTRF